jgi:hypothetical protein
MRRSHHSHAGGLIDSEDPPALSTPAGISQTATLAQQYSAIREEFTFVINSGHNLPAK